jgi:acid phosphatase (class A)
MTATSWRFACVVAASLQLGACGAAPSHEARTPSQSTAATYVKLEQLEALPPPPAAGSPEAQADEAAVRAWKDKRVEADCARAEATFFVSFRHLWGERSPFPEPLPAEVQAFFDRLDAEIGSASKVLKSRYRRSRPDPADACPPMGGRKGGGFAYPSTHAAISRLFAHVLTDLVPERRAEFFERADAIAHDRLVAGVHYPTDLAAGKELADRFHAALLRSRAYREDLAEVGASVNRHQNP